MESSVLGFTRTLKTAHHNNCGGLGGDDQLALRSAHKVGHFLVYDFYYLLCGNEGFKDLCAHRALGNDFYKVFNYLEVNVCLEKRKLDLAHTGFNVGFGKLSFIFEFLKSVVEFFAKALEHYCSSFSDGCPNGLGEFLDLIPHVGGDTGILQSVE